MQLARTATRSIQAGSQSDKTRKESFTSVFESQASSINAWQKLMCTVLVRWEAAVMMRGYTGSAKAGRHLLMIKAREQQSEHEGVVDII